uniref:Receptor-type tyrosine-protein phosphatase C n=1 Tax=Callorhinchus milii TaxID=7868 RepID=A0A4W3I7K0_CALMI
MAKLSWLKFWALASALLGATVGVQGSNSTSSIPSTTAPTETTASTGIISSTAPPTAISTTNKMTQTTDITSTQTTDTSTASPVMTSANTQATSDLSNTSFTNSSTASTAMTVSSSAITNTSTAASVTSASSSTIAYTSATPASKSCDYTLTEIKSKENILTLQLNDTTGQYLHVYCNNTNGTKLETNRFQFFNFLPCTTYSCSANTTKCNQTRDFSRDPPSHDQLNFTITTKENDDNIDFKVEGNKVNHSCKLAYQWNCSAPSVIKNENPEPTDNYTVQKNKTLTSCIEYRCSIIVSLQNNQSYIFFNGFKSVFPKKSTLETPFNVSNRTNTTISGHLAFNNLNIRTNFSYVDENGNETSCESTDTTFNCQGLTPFTSYNICLKASLMCNINSINTKKCSDYNTTEGVPGNIIIRNQQLNANNEIQIDCVPPKDLNGPPGLFYAKLENSGELQNKEKCHFKFPGLNYHTIYTIQVWASNSKHNGSRVKVTFATSYNENALIGFLVFLIILTSVALIVVLWKIYSLQKKSSRDCDEDVELIEHDDEKQLLHVEPILAEHLLDAFRSKQADEARLFLAEFQSIPRVFNKFPVKEARKPYNSIKNRYVDILPYDHNRVSLSPESGVQGSDYINASYIDGFNELRKYIAAQGPKEETSNDFWKMVWEQKTTIIVMVTRCEEGNRPKCAHYWPSMDEQNKSFGDLVIRINEEKWCPDYVVRKLFISHKKEKPTDREVTHIQFISWPDHGVPEDPQLLLKLRRRVNAFSNFFSGPIIVHCSAGVGRTGSYIGIDAMMQGLEAEGHVDIYGYIVGLRRQRCLMVQVEAQYILIHQALLEHYIFGETEICLSELPKELINLKREDPASEPSMLVAEFQRIPSYDAKSKKTGKLPENQSKNHSVSVIPFEYNRVTVKLADEKSKESENDSELSSSDDDDDDECTKYINASFIDGYWYTEALIATQTPLQETIADFWQMVFQRKTAFIVMLSKLKEDTEDFTEYWGEEDKTYDDIEVKLTECNNGPEFIVRTFEIKHGKRKDAHKVYQYHYHKWTDSDLPENPSSFIEVIRTLKEKLPKPNGPNRAIAPPIVVHCSDGAKLTGIFCALWNLLDSADTENIIDVFYMVKLLRKQRSGMILTFEQFEFLYDTIASTYPVQNGTLKSSESPLQTTVEIISETPQEESKQVSDGKSEEVSEVPAEEQKPEADTLMISNQQKILLMDP